MKMERQEICQYISVLYRIITHAMKKQLEFENKIQ